MAPLTKQLLGLDFTQGMDVRTDVKLVMPGKLARLENCHWSSSGTARKNTISKRYGSQPLSQDVLGGGSIASAEALEAFKNELLMVSSKALYSYSSAADKWAPRGAANDATFAHLSLRQVAGQGDMITVPRHDSASAGGFTVVAYFGLPSGVGATPELFANVIDNSTGALIQRTQLSTGTVSYNSTSSGPRVVAVGTSVLVFWVTTSGQVRVRVLDTGNPETFGAETTIRTDAHGTGQLAAVAHGSNVVISYKKSTASDLMLVQTSAAGVVAGSPAPITITPATAPQGPLALASDGTRIYVVYGLATVCELRVYTSAFVISVAAATLDAAKPARIAIGAGIGGVAFTALIERDGGGLANEASKATFTSAGVSGVGAVLLHNVRIVGDIGVIDSRGFALVNHNVTLFSGDFTVQPSSFVIDVSTGDVVARVLAGSAQWVDTQTYSPPRAIVSGSQISWAVIARGKITFGATGDYSLPSLQMADLVFKASAEIQRAIAGGCLHFAAALPMVYDGNTLVESGFNLAPEGLIAQATGAAGSLSAGSYQWIAMAEWTNSAGIIERSTPSPPLSATLAASKQATIRVPTIGITRKKAARGNIQIHLFRTEANGTIFYKSSVSGSGTENNTGADYVDIVDNLADADLISNELLPTTGGVLEAVPPPAHKLVHAHGDRLFIGGLENPRAIRYSTKSQTFIAPRFNEALEILLPEDAGPPTAFATVDDKLIVFTENNRIFAVTGDGPDEAGLNNSFSQPLQISSEASAYDWRSVCNVPEGVTFWDGKMIWLLNRALQLVPIGADVERWTDSALSFDVVKATWVSDQNEVRFQITTAGLDYESWGFAAVYDFRYQQWSLYTEFGGTDAALFGGLYVRMSATDGVLHEETPGVAASDCSQVIETGWIRLGAVQGLQRVYSAQLLGEIIGGETLRLSVWYDFQAAAEVVDISPAGAGGVLQHEHQPATQKCSAIRFTIEEIPGGSGAAWSLTNITLEVGLKKGLNKLPAAQRT